jgi:Family of unknown function (DUF5681)
MKEPNPKNRKALAVLPDRKPYTVGHGKPPEATRFKPGQSGNPKGRPKGKKTRPEVPQHERLQSIILDEAYRAIKVNDGSKQVSVPMAQAIMRSLAVTAAKGNTRAQKLFSELLSNTELSNKQADDEWLQTMIHYKSDWEMELERRKFQGITSLPDPLPHPDDIIVDFRRGTVAIQGPMDKFDLADLDLWLTRRHGHRAQLKSLLVDKDNPEYAPCFDILELDIDYTKRILGIIETALKLRASPICVQRRLSELNLKIPDYLRKTDEELAEDQ